MLKSSENCLNSAPNPVVGRESHLAVQLSGHWRAGYALLPCCWCGDLPPVGLKAVGLVRLPLDRTGHRYSPSGFGSGLCTTTGHLRNLPPYFRPSRRNENETLGQWQAVDSCNCKKRMEARVGIEPTYKGFADLSLTTWVPRQ